MKRITAFVLFLLLMAVSGRTDSYLRQPSIDVLHYEISMELAEKSDSIAAMARIHIIIRSDHASGMWLDLSRMHVDRLRIGGTETPFTHRNDRLWFSFDREYTRDETVTIEVDYHGTPNNAGMRIGENR